MTILDALREPLLFGSLPSFRDLSTWRPWLVFLSALYGLPLEQEELELFRRHTGRTAYTPPSGGWPEAVAIVGRQAGKSLVSALVAVYEAMRAPGAGLYSLLVAQDHRAALRVLLHYAHAVVRGSPVLRASVLEQTQTALTLETGATLAAYPCRPAAVRGLRARVAVLDELAYFLTSEGNPADREMLRAVRPCLATTGGKLLVLSSPYGQSGALWDLHRQHHGREGSPVLVWQASAPDMNPSLSADYLARMQEEDPEAYRSEVLGEFRTGVSSLFDPEALEAVLVPGRRELPPVPAVSYRAFADPSGGRADAFTLAVGHLAEDGTAIVDLVRAWSAPFNPSGVVEEAAAVLGAYGVGAVRGDRYAGDWPGEAFSAQRVAYVVAERPKSDLYLELLAAVNSARVELPDVPELLRELRGLERRRGTSGRDRVDHRPGAHDDLANAVAGLVACELRQPGLSLDPSAYGWFALENEQEAGWVRW